MSNVLKNAAAVLNALNGSVKLIEIGTSYGREIGDGMSPNVGHWIAIDPMYHWVPDLPPDLPFESEKTDQDKVDEWHRNSEAALPDVQRTLIIGKSWDVAADPARSPILSGSSVLVIDGCHHPKEAVERDYWDFAPFMLDEHWVLFDDIHQDPGAAAHSVRDELQGRGHLVSYEESANVAVLHVRRT